MRDTRTPHATLAGLLTAAAFCAVLGPEARASGSGDPVTASKWTINTGANFISAPAHATPAHGPMSVVKVTAAAGNTITLDQALPTGSYGPAGAGPFPQYVVVLRHDGSQEGNGFEGDWMNIASVGGGNTVITLSPDKLGNTASAVFAPGDIVEVIKRFSLEELLGSGPTYANNLKVEQDTDFNDLSEDAGYILVGSAFANTLFYHNGGLAPAGWYLDFSIDLGSGATYTFDPDQPIFLFREDAATDLTVAGTLQTYSLTHYLTGGITPFSTGFEKPAAIGISGLLESTGFIQDSDFSDATPDNVFTLSGTAFLNTLFYHDGTLTAGARGWYVDFSALDNNFPLEPGIGFFSDNGNAFAWRHLAP